MKTKLTIEMIPITTWNDNVRSMASQMEWDYLRKKTYRQAKYRCEICGGKGSKHPVECHEIWSFDNSNHIQKLERLIALCPMCHKVKHWGLSTSKGLQKQCMSHICKINGWTEDDCKLYLEIVYEQWMKRSNYCWKVDISILDSMLKEFREGFNDLP